MPVQSFWCFCSYIVATAATEHATAATEHASFWCFCSYIVAWGHIYTYTHIHIYSSTRTHI